MSSPRKMISKILIVAILFAATLSQKPEQAKAQAGIEVEDPQVTVDFGRTITFQAKIKSPIPIRQVSLLFRGVNEEVTRVETLQVAEDGSVSFTYDASLNAFQLGSVLVSNHVE